jgi:hypothetical protein
MTGDIDASSATVLSGCHSLITVDDKIEGAARAFQSKRRG